MAEAEFLHSWRLLRNSLYYVLSTLVGQWIRLLDSQMVNQLVA